MSSRCKGGLVTIRDISLLCSRKGRNQNGGVYQLERKAVRGPRTVDAHAVTSEAPGPRSRPLLVRNGRGEVRRRLGVRVLGSRVDERIRGTEGTTGKTRSQKEPAQRICRRARKSALIDRIRRKRATVMGEW